MTFGYLNLFCERIFVDIEKIRSGRPKPTFIIALEWLTIGAISALALAFVASRFFEQAWSVVILFTFILLIEVGLLATFYGIEGAKYGLIWLSVPTPSGVKRLGFGRTLSLLISLIYILMGLALILLAIVFVYVNSGMGTAPF